MRLISRACVGREGRSVSETQNYLKVEKDVSWSAHQVSGIPKT